MLTEIPHVFRENNQNTKTKNVLDKGKGEIPFPEKLVYTRIRDSTTHVTASAHLRSKTEQDQGGKAAGQYFSADRSRTPDTSAAFSLQVCSLLLLLQNAAWYFTSVTMLYILSFFFFFFKENKKHNRYTHNRYRYQICISPYRWPGFSNKRYQTSEKWSYSLSC